MRYISILLFSFLFLVFQQSFSQCYTIPASVKPTTNGTYSNSMVHEPANNRYRFHCYGADTISFSYYTNSSGSFYPIKMEKAPTSFWPAVLGGPLVHVNQIDSNKPCFDPYVTYSLIAAPTPNGDTLDISWKMKYKKGTVRDSCNYKYRFHIHGKTLVLRVLGLDNKMGAIDLNRSEGTTNANLVPIPYFTGSAMVETNGYFMTTLFDWEKGDASTASTYGGVLSPSSAYYASNVIYHTRSNGVRNVVKETIYFTVSKNLNEAMPNLTNPIIASRDSSANRIIFEDWRGGLTNPFTDEVSNYLSKFKQKGIKNIWYIMHSWQNAGYDRQYPDVLPANAGCSGTPNLKKVADSCHFYGYLFSLHENYVNFMRSAPSFVYADNVITPYNKYEKFYDPIYYQDTVYSMKPSKMANYVNLHSTQIHSTFNTDGLFLDIHSAAGLGSSVDYDASLTNPAKMTETLKLWRQGAGLLKTAHGNGLISGEGRSHYLYVGYFDDFEAQINCSYNNAADQYMMGIRMPLFVDFKLNKCHQQTPFHGVGYYERFFSRKDGAVPFWPQKDMDSSLIYIATEIAYGNGAHIPETDRVIDIFKVAKVEYEHTYKIFKWIYKACADSIRYNDNGTMITASKYIAKYPGVFDSIKDPDFMSQVRINYNNGVIVYVNRNPFKTWVVNLATSTGTVDYHATVANKDSLFHGVTSMTNYTLPINSGWLVYLPASLTAGMSELKENKPLVSCYPNPFNNETMFTISSKNTGIMLMEIFDINGRKVYSTNKPMNNGINTILWNGNNLNGEKCAKGIYFANFTIGEERTTIKVVLQ